MQELDNGWEIIKGKTPTLLVASHNFPQIREDFVKPRDIGTGDLVRKMCTKFGCWGIVSTRVQMDPNWYITSPFRTTVFKLITTHKIKITIDVHGKDLENPYFMMLYPNRTFSKQYEHALKGYTTRSFLNNEQLTLIEELDHKMIPGVEAEVREDGRVQTINPEIYLKINALFEKFVETLIS